MRGMNVALDSFFDFLFGEGMELFDGKIRFKISETKLRHKLKEQSERYFKETFAHLSLSREFDYGGLTAFIGEELFGEIAQCLQTPHWEERRRKEVILLREVYSCAQAHTPGSQKEVKACFEFVLRLVQAFLFEVEDTDTRSNHIVDEVCSLLWKSENAIRQELVEIREALEAKDSFRSFIDAIKPKTPSTDPFHYLCPAIQFQGREREFAALDAFLEDERPLLCSIITGSGGAGKSRLMYEYTQTRFWELGKLSDEDYGRMISDYGKARKREIPERRREDMISFVKKLELEQSGLKAARPLIVLFVADAYLSRGTYRELDTTKLISEVVERYCNHWRKVLCKGDEELYNAMTLLLVYSTAMGSWNLEDELPPPFDRAAETLLKLTRRELAALCCGIGHKAVDEEVFPSLEPDIIGEFFVLDYFRNCNKMKLRKLADALWQAPGSFIYFLFRCSNDYLRDTEQRRLFYADSALLNPQNLSNAALSVFCSLLVSIEVEFILRQEIAQVEALARRVKSIYEFNIENEGVVVAHAKSLVNLLYAYKDTESREKVVSRLKAVYETCENKEKVEIEYAKGLVLFSAAYEEARCCEEVISRLKEVHETCENKEEAAIVYAFGLFRLSLAYKDAKHCEEVISRLKSVYEICGNNEEVAVVYAKGLFNLSNAYEDSESREEVISRLKSVYETCENNEEVAVEYMKGLFNLSNAYKDAERREEVISRLKAVYETCENNEEVAVAYAKGLFNLSVAYKDAECCEKVISRLKAVYEASENKEEMEIWYAKGLFNLSLNFIASKEKMDLDDNAFLTRNFVYRPITAIVIRFVEDFLARVEDEETKRVLAEMREALLTHLDHME